MLKEIISLLENKLDFEDGKPCVLNPVDKRENLSIKWKEDPIYYSEFLEWINQLKFDFSVDALELLPYHKKTSWKLKIWKQVRLKATVYQKSFRPQILTNGCPVGKDAKIKFEVEPENISLYEIYWQVTNTGIEAQTARHFWCLMGCA